MVVSLCLALDQAIKCRESNKAETTAASFRVSGNRSMAVQALFFCADASKVWMSFADTMKAAVTGYLRVHPRGRDRSSPPNRAS
jgi:hypothetical protein